MRWLWLVAALAAPGAGLAQDLPDASLPDASVGQGGADQGSEENDTGQGRCLDSRACDHGTSCQSGRCVPVPVRDAECGGAAVMAAPGLLGVRWLRRRRLAHRWPISHRA
jgi:hypothetical protein